MEYPKNTPQDETTSETYQQAQNELNYLAIKGVQSYALFRQGVLSEVDYNLVCEKLDQQAAFVKGLLKVSDGVS